MKIRTLILEDEPNLGNTLQMYLNKEDHNCFLATSLKEAKEFFKEQTFNLAVLDMTLPDGVGTELGKWIRLKYPKTVIVFLTAQNDPDIRLECMEFGAKDYITKPFKIKEFKLRIDRIIDLYLRDKVYPERVKLGKLEIYFPQYLIKDALGHKLPITHKECEILKILYDNVNNVVPRDKIIDSVWGESIFPSNRTVDNYIVKLRKWCDTDTDVKIISIRGIGYKLVTEGHLNGSI